MSGLRGRGVYAVQTASEHDDRGGDTAARVYKYRCEDCLETIYLTSAEVALEKFAPKCSAHHVTWQPTHTSIHAKARIEAATGIDFSDALGFSVATQPNGYSRQLNIAFYLQSCAEVGVLTAAGVNCVVMGPEDAPAQYTLHEFVQKASSVLYQTGKLVSAEHGASLAEIKDLLMMEPGTFVGTLTAQKTIKKAERAVKPPKHKDVTKPRDHYLTRINPASNVIECPAASATADSPRESGDVARDVSCDADEEPVLYPRSALIGAPRGVVKANTLQDENAYEKMYRILEREVEDAQALDYNSEALDNYVRSLYLESVTPEETILGEESSGHREI